METQAERLKDTDTAFTFHWEWTRMRLVIMFNSTVSVSLWQRYYLYTYACRTYCRCSAHCAIHPQVLRWPLKKRRNSTENNSTYPATRRVQLERSGLSCLNHVWQGRTRRAPRFRYLDSDLLLRLGTGHSQSRDKSDFSH